MITYKTSTPNSPPASPQQRADAMKGFDEIPDYGYGQSFADNYSRLSGAGAYDRAAQMANAAYGANQLAAERQSVLAGLGMMADEQSRQQNLSTQRMQAVASLLGGLYR